MTATPAELRRLATDIANVFPPVRELLESGEDVHIPVILELLQTANDRMGTLCDMIGRLDDGEPPKPEQHKGGMVYAEDVESDLLDIFNALELALRAIHEERRACDETGVLFPTGIDQANGPLQLCLDGLNHQIAHLRKEAEKGVKPAA